jgi:hypothetical protein
MMNPVNRTRVARRPLSWSSIAAIVVEAALACGFVIAAYELLVAGGTALLPHASDDWTLLFWIAAAAIAGSGMTVVRSRARVLAHRLIPGSRPPPALLSSVWGAVAAGPAEDALPRLARLLAEGTGARAAAVWLAGPSGLRRAGAWPEERGGHEASGHEASGHEDGGHEAPGTVASEAALHGLDDVDHVAPVRDGGELLGALTLQARTGRFLTPPDLRLTADVANAAALLLRNAELTRRLRRQVRLETGQAGDLSMSRRRVVVARDAAREQLSAEIQARVCEPLELCARRAASVGPSPRQSAAGLRLTAEIAEMTAEIDAAIADFRRIVHGVYPAVLTDHGLLAALENLLAELDPRAVLVSHPMPRPAAGVEAGVYFCAAALLREWEAVGARRPMRVIAGMTPDVIHLTFIDGVPDTPERPALPVGTLVLESVRDRVAALDGSLRVDADASGRWLGIEVPLAPAAPAPAAPAPAGPAPAGPAPAGPAPAGPAPAGPAPGGSAQSGPASSGGAARGGARTGG